jgi:type IV pilus assembly protein PilX
MKAMRYCPLARQSGAVLITGLIILLVMTIIGVSSMQTVILEEKMAGNLRDRNVAFQAAEAGLQMGLTYLEAQSSPPLPDSSGSQNVWPGCLVSDDSCGPRDDETYENWLETRLEDEGKLYDEDMGANELEGVSQQPLIVIEDRYVPPLEFESAAEGRGIHYYTVGAYARGVTENPRVLLHTTIAKVYAW